MVTLTDADAYHLARQTAEWLAADDITKGAALIRAADYIAINYTLACTITVAHPIVQQATMALAPHALAGSLLQPAAVDVVREKLDGVGEIEYADRSVSDPFVFVTRILAPVALKRGGGFTIVTVSE